MGKIRSVTCLVLLTLVGCVGCKSETSEPLAADATLTLTFPGEADPVEILAKADAPVSALAACLDEIRKRGIKGSQSMDSPVEVLHLKITLPLAMPVPDDLRESATKKYGTGATITSTWTGTTENYLINAGPYFGWMPEFLGEFEPHLNFGFAASAAEALAIRLANSNVMALAISAPSGLETMEQQQERQREMAEEWIRQLRAKGYDFER